MTEFRVNRRDLLRAAGAGAVGAGIAAGPATAQAQGPTVYVGAASAEGGYVYAVDAGDGSEVWSFETGEALLSSPTVVDGTVYIGCDDKNMYALDAATGETQWQFEVDEGHNIWSSPTVVDGTVFFATLSFNIGETGGAVYAVDATTGTEEWTFTGAGEMKISPTVRDGTVYVGSDALYALDATTGTEEWMFETPSSFVDRSPTVDDGTAYVIFNDGEAGTLYAIDTATAEQEWTFEASTEAGSLLSAPTVVDGTVYIGGEYNGGDGTFGDEDGVLYAVDAVTGTEEWAFTEPSLHQYRSPTVADGTVYIGSKEYLGGGPPEENYSASVYAVDATTGQQEWAFTEAEETFNTSPTVANGTVYLGDEEGKMYALDATTGTEEWTFTDPLGLTSSSPTVVDDPESGDSIDSRVNLGTFGHHHVWAGIDSTEETGIVTGSVTDPNGAPHAEMTVGFRPADGESVEKVITTDEEGTYAAGLPTGDYDVVVEELGYESVTAPATVSADTETTVDMTTEELTPGTVTGTVTDEEGTPLAGVEINSAHEDAVIGTTTTDESGSYTLTLPPATYDVTATADGFGRYTGEVSVLENDTTEHGISLSEGPPALPGLQGQPQDLDGDGLFEDIDGNGEFTIFDVQAFFTNFQSETVQSNPAAFNFTEEENPEEVTIFDVQALFERL
jgi:outer membrane protein assembly factor BamB